MPDDLGGRLTRAGLVTRADLAELVAAAPPHDAALVRALVRRGVPEDALAGFFLSEGFGPLLDRQDLDRAEPVWANRLPSAMALDFLALPLRAATNGIVVAMAAPSDAHIVRELTRVLGERVLATIARPSHIESRVRVLHPNATLEAARAPEPEPPPVLELTRRRSTTERGFDPGFRAPDGTKEAKLGPRLALPDDEPAMPLVRHKPSLTPGSFERVAPASAAPVVAKTFARPEPADAWRRGEPRRSNTQPLIPAIAPLPTSTVSISIPPAPPAPTGPPTMTSHPPATSLVGALTDLAERTSEPAASIPPAPAAPSMIAPSIAPAPMAPSVDAPSLPPAATAPSTAPPQTPSIAPIDATSPGDRWDLPSSPPAAPKPPRTRDAANKLSSRASAELPTIKAAPADIGAILQAMRGATDRDEVVRLACEGGTSVARAAVFFALRKGVLKGWDGAGPGVRRDSVRNLWIPTSSPSTFKKVLDTKTGSLGPYGTSVADGLFRAAVGSRGGDFMVQPVVVAGKVVGMLCVDDLRPGPLGAHRVEVLTQTVGDSFVRIISAGKET